MSEEELYIHTAVGEVLFISKTSLIEALRVALEQTQIVWDYEHYWKVKTLYESISQ